jgi:hypothetical protein
MIDIILVVVKCFICKVIINMPKQIKCPSKTILKSAWGNNGLNKASPTNTQAHNMALFNVQHH